MGLPKPCRDRPRLPLPATPVGIRLRWRARDSCAIHAECGLRQKLHAAVVRPRKQQLHVADRAFDKTTFAIGQIELPHPHEALVISECAHRLVLLYKALAPIEQGDRKSTRLNSSH